jgi:TetR/AcrR family transcriptional repressor of nem operon
VATVKAPRPALAGVSAGQGRESSGAARYDVGHDGTSLMPWPRGHKSRTRAEIVEAAAAAFRACGVAGVRLDELMASTGRTRGGFYAHFSSKDALLAAALELASRETIEALSGTLERIPAEQRLHAVIDAYLTPQHAAHPERGCPVAALGPELVRAGGSTRRHIARSVKRRLAWLRSLTPPQGDVRVGEEQVIGALACMVGGVILARVVGRTESALVLEACREFLHRVVGQASSDEAGVRATSRRSRPNPEPRSTPRGGRRRRSVTTAAAGATTSAV